MKRGGELGAYGLRFDDDDVTVAIVSDCVEWVGEWIGSGEAMDMREAALHQELLRAIAEGRCSDPAACAAEALRTLKIYAPGWSTMPMVGAAAPAQPRDIAAFGDEFEAAGHSK